MPGAFAGTGAPPGVGTRPCRMSDDPYVYPGTNILRNKFGIEDAAKLEETEQEFVTLRSLQPIPTGNFDLPHLQSIHHHLFQDIYDWAGEIRTVEINKGGSQFLFRQYIETGMADVHKRLVDANYLQRQMPDNFARNAAEIVGDINYVHPFREGNGRTQLQYLKQLGERAGHEVDLRQLEPATWQAASIAAFDTTYEPMADCIDAALVQDHEQEQGHLEDRFPVKAENDIDRSR